MKADVFVQKKLLMNFKDDASDARNPNTGTSLIRDVKIVPLELIIPTKIKAVNHVLHNFRFGMANTV